jgi:hypothetical protein
LDKIEADAKNAAPKLSEGTINIVGPHRTATFEELYKAATALREKKILMSQKRQTELLNKEMQEATFKPHINHSTNISSKINSKHNLVSGAAGDDHGEHKFSSLQYFSFNKEFSYKERHEKKIAFQQK